MSKEIRSTILGGILITLCIVATACISTADRWVALQVQGRVESLDDQSPIVNAQFELESVDVVHEGVMHGRISNGRTDANGEFAKFTSFMAAKWGESLSSGDQPFLRARVSADGFDDKFVSVAGDEVEMIDGCPMLI